jgi:hypothetical protein
MRGGERVAEEGDSVGRSYAVQLLSAYRSSSYLREIDMEFKMEGERSHQSGRPRWRETGTKITEKEDMRRFTHRKFRVLGLTVLGKSKMRPILWTRIGRPV